MNDDLLVLTADAHQSMIAHALAGLPHEACGLFAGPGDGLMVDQFFAMTNAAASREIYVLDGNEMLEVEAQVDADQRTLVGVMHSHTHTTAYPSPTDVGVDFYHRVVKAPQPVTTGLPHFGRDDHRSAGCGRSRLESRLS